MIRTVTVATWAVSSLEKEIKSLVRAARRAGIEPVPAMKVDWATKREVRQERVEIYLDGGRKEGETATHVVVPVVDCRVSLPDEGFKVGGDWRVLGVLQRVMNEGGKAERGNEIFTAPGGVKKMETFRLSALECEHCRAKRVRTKTLILENTATGAMKQVGKECAGFYVQDRAEAAIRDIEFQSAVAILLGGDGDGREVYFGGGGGAKLSAWDASEVLAHACACIREHGWQPNSLRVPGRFSDEDDWVPNPASSARKIEDMLKQYPLRHAQAEEFTRDIEELEQMAAAAEGEPLPPGTPDVLVQTLARAVKSAADKVAKLKIRRDELLRPSYSIEAADRARAALIEQWLDGQSPDPEQDQYLASLKEAYAPGWISEKRLGFAISLVRAWERAIEQAEAITQSHHVGQPGDRQDFILRLQATVPYGGQFPGTVYKFQDAQGNRFTWMSSASPFEPGAVGKTFSIKATVKAHSEYKGVKGTDLSRVKVLKEIVTEENPAIPAAVAATAEHAEPPEGLKI